jgi:hypothetical protein
MIIRMGFWCKVLIQKRRREPKKASNGLVLMILWVSAV